MVQKYIENPLIINRKKFDIRQWVLVTDWNPLTVLIYQECYIRFALVDYSASTKSRYAHMTNNCLVRKFNNENSGQKEKLRDKSVEGEGSDDEEEEELDNIWSLDDFKGHLQKEFGNAYPETEDIYTSIIYP